MLWRGDPLAIEFVDAAEDGAPAADTPAWVLHDLELLGDDGRVERAHLRSNGERMTLPFDALHLARPSGSSAGGARMTPRSAAWHGALQNGGEDRNGVGDRHTPLFAERVSERLEGEFQDSEPAEYAGQSLVVRLRSANNHYHRVSLAPAEWLAAHEARPVAGTRLAARGVRTRDAKGGLFVARELELDGRTVVLRREDGVPLWTPAPEPTPQPQPQPDPAPGPEARPIPEPASEPTIPPAAQPIGEPQGANGSAPAVEDGPPAPEPLLRQGRLSAQALLVTPLATSSATAEAPRAFAVSAFVIDLDAGRVSFLALRPVGTGDAEETWTWVPWEALDWRAGHPWLRPAAEPGPAPSAGIDVRTLLPADSVLARARRHWLGGA